MSENSEQIKGLPPEILITVEGIVRKLVGELRGCADPLDAVQGGEERLRALRMKMQSQGAAS
jgi:hypothetical protein